MPDKTILIVDDDPNVAELITEILTLYEYNVLVAHDGLQAVEHTNHHHINLILMDIRMPYFSGLWFCDTFRRKKNTCNIPVIMISALLDEESEEKARKAGAVATMKKPFTEGELVRMVQKHVI